MANAPVLPFHSYTEKTMARARQPRAKGETTEPEILRAIRLGDAGDVYGPGEEDEFLEALEQHVDDHNATVAEQQKAGNRSVKKLDVNDELKRLHVLGHLVNFQGVEVTDDDLEESDQDLTANRVARERALVSAPGNEGTSAARPKRLGRNKERATQEGVQSSEEFVRLNDGAGEVVDGVDETSTENVPAVEAKKLKAEAAPDKAKTKSAASKTKK